MATELLERAAIPYLEDNGITYVTPKDDLIGFQMTLNSDGDEVYFTILDHGNSILTIVALDLVKFTENQESQAIEMCNALNQRAFGKFIMNSSRDVVYTYDLPTRDSTGPEYFGHAFHIVAITVIKFYPVIMAVRWGNVTIEQALGQQRDIESENPDNSDDQILSDEQIWRLLGREDSDQE